jgi:hypothetical protein
MSERILIRTGHRALSVTSARPFIHLVYVKALKACRRLNVTAQTARGFTAHNRKLHSLGNKATKFQLVVKKNSPTYTVNS